MDQRSGEVVSEGDFSMPEVPGLILCGDGQKKNDNEKDF